MFKIIAVCMPFIFNVDIVSTKFTPEEKVSGSRAWCLFLHLIWINSENNPSDSNELCPGTLSTFQIYAVTKWKLLQNFEGNLKVFLCERRNKRWKISIPTKTEHFAMNYGIVVKNVFKNSHFLYSLSPTRT